MSWKSEFDEKFKIQEVHRFDNSCLFGGYAHNAVKDFIEALIKETEKRVAKEIFDTLEQCEFMDMGLSYEIGIKNFESFREKYNKRSGIRWTICM